MWAGSAQGLHVCPECGSAFSLQNHTWGCWEVLGQFVILFSSGDSKYHVPVLLTHPPVCGRCRTELLGAAFWSTKFMSRFFVKVWKNQVLAGNRPLPHTEEEQLGEVPLEAQGLDPQPGQHLLSFPRWFQAVRCSPGCWI